MLSMNLQTETFQENLNEAFGDATKTTLFLDLFLPCSIGLLCLEVRNAPD